MNQLKKFLLALITALLLVPAAAQAQGVLYIGGNGPCYMHAQNPYLGASNGLVFDGNTNCYGQYNWISDGTQLWDQTYNAEIDGDRNYPWQNYWYTYNEIGPDNSYTNGQNMACVHGHTYSVWTYGYRNNYYYQVNSGTYGPFC